MEQYHSSKMRRCCKWHFDPWMFESQEALLCGMYDVILSKTGIKYSTYSSKQIVRKLKDLHMLVNAKPLLLNMRF